MAAEAGRRPVLRVITPDATAEEVAAIVAAVSASLRSAPVGAATDDEALHEWVHGSRLGARRAGLQRGPWRLSGRIGRRHRA
jgi:acyl-CoA carboxylase epsilon subunit-like protein